MATEFISLISDLEVHFPSGVADSRTIHVLPVLGNIAFDIVNEDGATVSLLACNAKKELVEAGDIEIVDSEMGAHTDSPFSASAFNKTFIAPNFIRVKTNGVGAVIFRARGNR